MYALIWRLLPGPVWLKVVEAAVLVTGVLALLSYVVFPWVNQFVDQTGATVGE